MPSGIRYTPAMRQKFIRVDAIINQIIRMHSGRPAGIPVCGTFNLSPNRYHDLLRRLAGRLEEYAFHHIKFSYDERKHLLSYEVPTKIHSDMATDLRKEINGQLDAIKDGSDMGAELLRLVKDLPASIPSKEFPGARAERQRYPDGTWAFHDGEIGLEVVCFAFEVCYAQRQPNAEHLVREMMYEKYGWPCLALVVTLRHNDPKKLQNPAPDLDRSASYTLWQWVEVVNQRGQSEHRVARAGRTLQFRDRNGVLVPGKLSFTLRDFIPEEMRPGNPLNNDADVNRLLDQTISIDHALLFGWLERAEPVVQNAARGSLTSEVTVPSREVTAPSREVTAPSREVISSSREVSKRPEEPRVPTPARVSKAKPVQKDLNIKHPHYTRAAKRAKAARRAQNDLNVNHPHYTRSKGEASLSKEDDDEGSGPEEVANSSDLEGVDDELESQIRVTLPLNSKLRQSLLQH